MEAVAQTGGSQGALCFQPQVFTVGVRTSVKKCICTSNIAVEKNLDPFFSILIYSFFLNLLFE